MASTTELLNNPTTSQGIHRLGPIDTVRFGTRLMRDDPLRAFDYAAVEHGRLFEIGAFGKRAVLIGNARDAKTILADRASATSKDTLDMDIFRGVFGNFILTRTDTKDWRPYRAAAQPAFDHDHVACYTAIVAEETKRYADALRDQVEGGGVAVADLHGDLTGITARIISRALFSHQLNDDEVERLRQAMIVSIRTASEGVQSIGLSWQLRALTPNRNREIKAAQATLQGFADDLIEERTSRGGDPDQKDMLDMFLAAHQADPDQFDREWLTDEVAGFFGAGHDTTASATLLALSNVSSADDELGHQLHMEAAAATDSSHLDLSQAVFKETLRGDPPVWLIVRKAEEDIALNGGETIRKGSTIGISPYLVHHDPSIWPDPETFDPLRFEGGFRPQAGTYIPFGLGARSCVGAPLAKVEGPLIISDLYRHFPHIEVDPIVAMEPSSIQRPAHPLQARFYTK